MKPHLHHLTDVRRWLHAHPELSGEEHDTAAYLFERLASLQPDMIRQKLGGNGILVLFDSGKPGPSVLFRAELDALPIHEINDCIHHSSRPGISHTCGHDGHATILLGLAEKLAEKRAASGKVFLLFQPAEETGEGAKKIMNDPAFAVAPDFVFALHNLPGFQKGEIVLKEGLFSAAVNSLVVRLKGKTTHAAEPQAGINPSIAISEIIRMADALNKPDPAITGFSLVTPVYINIGLPTYGTAAGEGELHYTLRCWDNKTLKELENKFLQGAAQIAKHYKLGMEHSFTQSFSANNNDRQAVDMVKQAAEALGYSISMQDIPFKWGEDFGYFTSAYKGCMFGLGAGMEQPALHNPDYDFPDDIIEKGVNIFYQVTQQLLT